MSRQRRQWLESVGMSPELAAEVDNRMAEALAEGMDPTAFYGTPPATEPTPREVHARLLGADGAAPKPTPTRAEGLIRTDPPHSGEQPTPKDRRDAWLDLHRLLVADMETQLSRARSHMPYASHPQTMRHHLGREWAALQLLKHLRDMRAPEVPEDPEPGQATIHDAIAEADAVGDGRRVHFVHADGSWVHPVLGSTRPPRNTGRPEQVTCRRCRVMMGWDR